MVFGIGAFSLSVVLLVFSLCDRMSAEIKKNVPSDVMRHFER